MSKTTTWRGFSERVLQIQPSMTMEVADRAKTLKSQGVEIIDLSVGEPDFDTPDHIKQAAVKAMESGYTKYTKNVGMDELREAVCAKFRRDNEMEYTPEEIIISSGGKHVLFNVMMALLNPGEEIIIFAPYWVTFTEMARLAGGEPVIITTKESMSYEPDIGRVRRAINPRTKAILINSPGNPTGAVYSEDTIGALVDLAREHGVFLISDECYDRVTYNGRHVSPASLEGSPGLVITVQSVSKPYAMTGWRIGYGGANSEIIEQMAKIQSQSTSNANSIAQYAAVEALTGAQSFIGEMVGEYRRRRDHTLGVLNRIPGVTCSTPQGAFYVFPNIAQYYGHSYDGKTLSSSLDMSYYLLDETHVAVVPGGGFGADDHIRISYATSMQELQRGMERIQLALEALR
ncbi:MAG TPA: pyridoxal phosphate-dependent aminotransferase [bacterium]|nr:pyridoxal phosphate-dependent aminotransferase [bacterium]